MAKKPAARKTAEQLRSMVWPDQASAMRDLKASRVSPAGVDYELGEYRPGSWQLLARDGEAAALGEAVARELAEQEMGPFPISVIGDPGHEVREQAVIDNLKRKRGAKPRGAPEVIIDATASAKHAHGLANGKANGVAETVTLFPDEEAAKPLNLLSPLPAADGPYELVITEASGDAFPRHGAHTAAIDLARRLKTPVIVRDKAGMTVRVYDRAALDLLKAPAKPRGGTAGGVKGAGMGEGKFPRAIALLSREQGATAAELEKACGWQNVTQRYVNRASRISGLGRIDHLGERHWRISKSGK